MGIQTTLTVTPDDDTGVDGVQVYYGETLTLNFTAAVTAGDTYLNYSGSLEAVTLGFTTIKLFYYNSSNVLIGTANIQVSPTWTLVSGDTNSNQRIDTGETLSWSTQVTLPGSITPTYIDTYGDADVDHVSLGFSLYTSDNSSQLEVSSPTQPIIFADQADPSISLEKTADQATYSNSGEKIVYTFAVTNDGNRALSDVTITDAQLDGVATAVGVAVGDIDGDGTLDSGETWAGDTDNDGVVDDTESWTYAKVGDLDWDGEDGTEVLGTADAILGDADNDGLLDVSETWIFTGSYTTDGEDTADIVNTATASAFYGEDSVDDTDTVTVGYVLPANPSLSLEKTADQATYSNSEEEIVYTFAVTNDGNVALSDVTITDAQLDGAATAVRVAVGDIDGDGTLDSGETWAGDTDNDGVVDGTESWTYAKVGDLDWDGEDGTEVLGTADAILGDADNDGLLDVSETWIFTGSYTTDGEDTADIVNTATASAFYGEDSVDDTDTVTVTYTPPPPNPSLSLEKTASVSSYSGAGEEITYTFAVTNDGNVALSDVTITDAQLDAVATAVRVAVGDIDGDGTLDSGETWAGDTDNDGVVDDTETWTYAKVGDLDWDGEDGTEVLGTADAILGDADNDGLLDVSETWIFTGSYTTDGEDTADIVNTATASAFYGEDSADDTDTVTVEYDPPAPNYEGLSQGYWGQHIPQIGKNNRVIKEGDAIWDETAYDTTSYKSASFELLFDVDLDWGTTTKVQGKKIISTGTIQDVTLVEAVNLSGSSTAGTTFSNQFSLARDAVAAVLNSEKFDGDDDGCEDASYVLTTQEIIDAVNAAFTGGEIDFNDDLYVDTLVGVKDMIEGESATSETMIVGLQQFLNYYNSLGDYYCEEPIG